MTNHESLARLVDANLNRALEGLRVCEDIVRFHWNDARGYRRCRSLRHAIAEAGEAMLPVFKRVAARAAERDVGKDAPAERSRSAEQVLIINTQRVKEALRVLEEAARLLYPKHTKVFQRLRFRMYEVERELLLRLATLRHR